MHHFGRFGHKTQGPSTSMSHISKTGKSWFPLPNGAMIVAVDIGIYLAVILTMEYKARSGIPKLVCQSQCRSCLVGHLSVGRSRHSHSPQHIHMASPSGLTIVWSMFVFKMVQIPPRATQPRNHFFLPNIHHCSCPVAPLSR